MARYRILITDLTEFGSLRCVAGWDLERNTMIRPEPAPAAFWQATRTGADQPFNPGHIVEFDADRPNPPTALPHANEDRVVSGGIQLVQRLGIEAFQETLGEIGSEGSEEVFGDPVEFANNKAYVSAGVDHASLVGLNIDRDDLAFTEDVFDGERKLRALLTLQNRVVNLSVAAMDLKVQYRASGVDEVSAMFDEVDRLHLRLGLARPFDGQPDRCYMQVNGVYRLE